MNKNTVCRRSGKDQYKTRADALEAIRKYRIQGIAPTRDMQVYRCTMCNFFHVARHA